MHKIFRRLSLSVISVIVAFSADLKGQVAGDASKIQGIKAVDIGNNSNFSGFEECDSFISKSRIVLVGVNHEYDAFNLKFEQKFLRFLNEKHGVKRYMMAVSPSRAGLIQRFIDGDTSVEKLLKSVTTPKFMKHYRQMKKINQKFPAASRLKVYGVDVEKNINLPAVYIADLLPGDSIPGRIRIGVEAIRGASSYIISQGLEDYDRLQNGKEEEPYYYRSRPFSVRYSVEEFAHYYDSLKPEFKKWIGDEKFASLEEAYGWIKQYRQWRKYEETAFEDVWREEEIYRNSVELLNQFPDDKFYCRWGRCHLNLQEMNGPCDFYQFNSLARRLTRGEKVYPIVSIPIFYTRTDQFISDMSDEPEKLKNELKYINNLSKDENARFVPLSKLDSIPYISSNYHLILLNNSLPLPGSDDDTAETDTRLLEKARKSYNRSMQSRVYLGYGIHSPYFTWKKVNASLENAGLPVVKNLSGHDFSLQINVENSGFVRYHGGYATDLSSRYALKRFGVSVAGNTLSDASELLKLNIGYNLGWIQHSIRDSVANPSPVFLDDVKLPSRITNPNLLTGAFAQFMVDFRFIYLSAEAGYNFDFSNPRWKKEGNYIGGVGSMRGTHWYWNVGVGLSIPLDSGNKYGGDDL